MADAGCKVSEVRLESKESEGIGEWGTEGDGGPTDDAVAILGVAHLGGDGRVADGSSGVSAMGESVARSAYAMRKNVKVTRSGLLRSLYLVAYTLYRCD